MEKKGDKRMVENLIKKVSKCSFCPFFLYSDSCNQLDTT